jgi:hypothetical protein
MRPEITTSQTALGWEIVDRFGDKHVMPIGDLRPHEPSMRCFCKPVWDCIGGNVGVHNAMDKREQYERQRKPT